MVFASRRAYVDIGHVRKILTEDNYRPLERDKVLPGDIVLYSYRGAIAHVGLVIQSRSLPVTSPTLDIWVLSKWGDDGEFIHYIENVPHYYGVPAEFYTERE